MRNRHAQDQDPQRQLTGAPLRRPGSQVVPGATSQPKGEEWEHAVFEEAAPVDPAAFTSLGPRPPPPPSAPRGKRR